MLKETKATSTTQIIFIKFLFGILLIIIAGFLVFGNWRIMKAREKVDLKLAQSQKELSALQLLGENLQGKILQGQTYDYLEKVARENLNLKKIGEQAVAFPSQEDFKETPSGQKIKDLWQKFLEMRKQEKEKARE